MIYEVEGLRQTYGSRTVVDIGHLEVVAGEILAIVGPSGAGKSTLLRLLNFLETPAAGTIAYRGQVIHGEAPLSVRRQITTVFQRPVLRHGSVRNNVAYGLLLRGQRVDGQVDAILEEVGLAPLSRQSAHALSGGEMQRVALARALVVRPEVLLLDEPTANLDPYNVSLIETLIRDHNRRTGTTVVLVTHNVFQARRLASRTGLMLNGQILELTDTTAFFGSPADPRTRAFVQGEMVY